MQPDLSPQLELRRVPVVLLDRTARQELPSALSARAALMLQLWELRRHALRALPGSFRFLVPRLVWLAQVAQYRRLPIAQRALTARSAVTVEAVRLCAPLALLVRTLHSFRPPTVFLAELELQAQLAPHRAPTVLRVSTACRDPRHVQLVAWELIQARALPHVIPAQQARHRALVPVHAEVALLDNIQVPRVAPA